MGKKWKHKRGLLIDEDGVGVRSRGPAMTWDCPSCRGALWLEVDAIWSGCVACDRVWPVAALHLPGAVLRRLRL